MKIKSIAAICKKNKNIAIFERYSDDGDILTQYIGDGSAVYPVVGLPQLDKESLLTIFDVPEKDRDNRLPREEQLLRENAGRSGGYQFRGHRRNGKTRRAGRNFDHLFRTNLEADPHNARAGIHRKPLSFARC